MWIIDVSPFVHWTAHGPVVDTSAYRDSVPRRRVVATRYLSDLTRDLNASGIPANYEVRTGLPAFEVSALRRKGDFLLVETDPECEQSREALDQVLMSEGDGLAPGKGPKPDGCLRAAEGLEDPHIMVMLGANADELCCGI